MRLKLRSLLVETQLYCIGYENLSYSKFRVPVNISPDLSLAVGTFHDAICQVANSGGCHYRFDDQGRLIRFLLTPDVSFIDQRPEWTFQQIRSKLLELALSPEPPEYALDKLPPFKLQMELIRRQTRQSLRNQFKSWFLSLFHSPGNESETLELINSHREAQQRRQHEIGWNFEQISHWYGEQWSAGEAEPAIRNWYAQSEEQQY